MSESNTDSPPLDGGNGDRVISWDLPPELAYFQTSEAYDVALPDFQGPLDLLLFLIQKNEIDIYDIPIAVITEQYLGYLEVIKALSLDMAGDFIVVAATLLRIKSRLLLPSQPDDEAFDEDDPRAELVRRLLEYKRYKEMAARLQSRERERSRLHVRDQRYPFLKESAEPPSLRLNMYELLLALSQVFDRVTKEAVHAVTREVYTVDEKVKLIKERLAEGKTIRFDELFKDDHIKMEVVVTFMAILELAKLGVLKLRQTELNGPIWVRGPAKRAAAAAGGGMES
ncbi:segregation/condensation protein A [bacterium]|nr:segregation/condensation protein A [bacterium]